MGSCRKRSASLAVFISGHDLVDALPQQGQRIMPQAVVLSRIA
jgi:hypothetical protein